MFVKFHFYANKTLCDEFCWLITLASFLILVIHKVYCMITLFKFIVHFQLSVAVKSF